MLNCHFNIEIILQSQDPCLFFHSIMYYQVKALKKYKFNTL